MADYQLTAYPNMVLRTAGGSIPNDPANADWQIYQQWLDDGGVPDPYVEPPPPPPPASAQIDYDHENRLRTLEGQPPLTLEEFTVKHGA